MRVGVLLLPTDPWPETVARVRHLEALGYRHVWTYDHLSWRRYRDRPWHAAVPWLTGLAGVTRTIRLGTLVASPVFRHPATFAKEVMTLDHVSSGRFTLGLGAGRAGFDSAVFGGPAPTPALLADRLAEFVEGVDLLLREPVGSYHGKHFSFDEARMLPGCVQQPRVPLAIAGGGPRALRIVARYADIWVTYGDATHRDRSAAGTERAVRAQSRQLAEHCAAIGRDPTTIERLYLIGNTEERPLRSVESFLDFAGRYRELGFTDLVFHDPRTDDPVWTDAPAIVEAIAEALR
jgi:alkanesulfonate monooxygenase SsuD/methylene tetrahydromethanopterin reductase-like flavin-dependent oxidoreductase (luciferase family)